jgi:membrane protease YdiL (CAAX protease family)
MEFAALFWRSPRAYRLMSSGRLELTLCIEVVLGGGLAVYLFRRGWRWHHVTLPFTLTDIGRGLGVWLLGYLAVASVSLLVSIFDPALVTGVVREGFRGRPPLVLVLLTALVNPVFEESLWLGYSVNGPGARSVSAALWWSLVPRLLVHLYQGWLALFAVAPLGLWYFAYYLKKQRLWPIVIAHGMQDLLSLGWLALHGAA